MALLNKILFPLILSQTESDQSLDSTTSLLTTDEGNEIVCVSTGKLSWPRSVQQVNQITAAWTTFSFHFVGLFNNIKCYFFDILI